VESESPAPVERRIAREAVRVARDARIAERKAAKLAAEARQAAALAAAQAAEAAAREAALKAEQGRPVMRNSLSRQHGKPPWKPSGRPLATPAMPPVKLGSEKADRSSVDRWTEDAPADLLLRNYP
jgi:multidrug efflux pump subunit AcrA (membrane-fusion protein)